ncbi:MAG: MCE family protein [Candidatus Kapabacteria bacterium]|nr:MCE family protein [Ignavibacteriota bacterium]MCW5883996.1 MCE family protein [Candidatus Kapabacteria bacterium]
MKNQKNKEITVGIVTFIALALLFLGISLGKGYKVTSEDRLLKIRFPNSGGVQVSEPVVVNGVKRGSIINVKNDNSSVLITVMLDNYNDIKSDANAKITLLEITGGKKIEINPGVESQKFNIQNEMTGFTPPDIAQLVTLVGEVSGDAVMLVRRLDTIAASATDLLADGEVLKDIRLTAKNAAELSANLNNFLDNNYTKLDNSISNLNLLTESLRKAVDKHEPTVANILGDIDTALDDVKILLKNVDTTIAGANDLIANVNTIAVDLRNGSGFASKLLYDKELMNKLDSAFINLSILLEQVNNHGVNVNVRLGTRP